MRSELIQLEISLEAIKRKMSPFLFAFFAAEADRDHNRALVPAEVQKWKDQDVILPEA